MIRTFGGSSYLFLFPFERTGSSKSDPPNSDGCFCKGVGGSPAYFPWGFGALIGFPVIIFFNFPLFIFFHFWGWGEEGPRCLPQCLLKLTKK